MEKRASHVCDGFREAARAADLVERPSLAESIKKVRRMIDRLELEIGAP
jgi:hypothetical protein